MLRPRRRRTAGCVRRPLSALIRDVAGQDLLEYALLSAFIGLAGLATMKALGITMGDVYAGWIAAVNALWETPTP